MVLVKDRTKQLYRTQLGTNNDEVIIGDETKPDKFSPRIKFTKWNKENSLTLMPIGELAKDLAGLDKPTLVNGKLEIKKKRQKIGWYANVDFNNSNNLKFGHIWYQKPVSNRVRYQIPEYRDYDFLYQDIWENTEEVINHHGVLHLRKYSAPDKWQEREPNVQGSYAIYHKTKRDHIIGRINYMFGKVGHWYRPKFIDANGSWFWGFLEFSDGVMDEICPWEFLETAVYPVYSNANWGYATLGGSLDYWSADRIVGLQMVGNSPGDAGTLNSVTIGLDPYWNSYWRMGLYTDNGSTYPGNKVAGEADLRNEDNGKTFYTSVGDFNTAISPNTTYWVVFSNNSTAGIQVAYDSDASYKQIGGSNDGSGTLVTPFPAGKTTYTGYKCTAYATYTPSGGANYTKTFNETMAISEPSMSKNATRTLSDNMTISEPSMRRGTAKEALEVMTISEVSMNKAAGKSIFEAVNLTDTYSRVFSAQREFSDTSVLSEIYSRILTAQRIFSEEITLSEVFSVVKAYFREFLETITLSEEFLRACARSFLDTSTLTDSVTRAITKLYSETATITDNILKAAGKVIADTITLTDSFLRAITRVFSDTVTLTEVFIKSIARAFLETITFTEAFFIPRIKVFLETVTLTETIIKFWARSFLETITLVEDFFKARVIEFLDTVTSSEAFTKIKSMYRVFSEVCTITDEYVRAMTRIFTEEITLSEILRKVYSWINKVYVSSSWNRVSAGISSWSRKTNVTATWAKISKAVSSWAKKSSADDIWHRKTY